MYRRVRLRAVLVALGLYACLPAQAGPVMLSAEEGRAFRFVGRLNIAGTGFCTATLIAETLIVTAAHCLYHPRTGNRLPDSVMHFLAGLHVGTHAAARRIRSSHVLPEYRFDGTVSMSRLGADVALLVLDRPISADDVRPARIGAATGVRGPVSWISYSRRRPHAPSVETGARIVGRHGRIMVLDLAVTAGASGSPILAVDGDGSSLLGIVSASSRSGGRPVALTVPVEHAVRRLRRGIGR